MGDVIKNHTENALTKLLEQYKERPKFKALLKALVSPLQEIEDQIEVLSKDRRLDTARGKQLDYLGEIVGEKRRSEDDKEFRRSIYSRILINKGGGTPEDIIAAIDLVYSPRRIDYGELYPASFHVFVQGINALTGVKPLIKSISPAGVGDIIITHLQADDPFACGDCGTQNFPLSVINEGNKFEVALLDNDKGEHTLEVTADTIMPPEKGLGFGEVIISESNLDIGDGEIYMVDENTTLVLVASLEDFIVRGCGKLAGVIEND